MKIDTSGMAFEIMSEIVNFVVKLVLMIMFIMALAGKPVIEFSDDFSIVFFKL